MTCPMCSKPAVARYRPFCSKRCADLDLGKWMSGDYAVAAEDEGDAEEIATARDTAEIAPPKPH